MSNVIEFIPGLKEMALKRSRERNIEKDIVDFRTIDPSIENKREYDNLSLSFDDSQSFIVNRYRYEEIDFNYETYDMYGRMNRFYISKKLVSDR